MEPTSQASAVLRSGQNGILSLAWSPDGTALIAADQDGQVARCPLQGGRGEDGLAGPAGEVLAEELYSFIPTALTPDGTQLASGQGQEVILRATADGLAQVSFRVDASDVKSLAFAPDGGALAAGCEDGSVVVWDTRVHRLRAALRGHRGLVNGLAFAPDSRLLASGSADGTLCVWDAATGRLRSSAKAARQLRSLAFSPDGLAIATCGADVVVSDAATGQIRLDLAREGPCYGALAYSPDGRRLAAADLSRGRITLWDLASPGRRATLRGRVGPGFALAFAPDGRTLASGGGKGMIELWTVAEVFGRSAEQ
jgi:WD40 repeat protein